MWGAWLDTMTYSYTTITCIRSFDRLCTFLIPVVYIKTYSCTVCNDVFRLLEVCWVMLGTLLYSDVVWVFIPPGPFDKSTSESLRPARGGTEAALHHSAQWQSLLQRCYRFSIARLSLIGGQLGVDVYPIVHVLCFVATLLLTQGWLNRAVLGWQKLYLE